MKAVKIKRYGQPEGMRIVELPKPVPKKNEILVKIYASAATNSDIFIRSGRVDAALVIPFRIMMGFFGPRAKALGIVYSGVVEAIGSDIKNYKVGDEVYGMTGFHLSAYAEYVCLREFDSEKRGTIAIKPRGISHEEATAVCYGGLLGFQALEKYPVQKGQKVLIYGASGTTGTMAVQYARHLGAEITAVCSSKNKELVMSLGADKHLDYRDPSSVSQLEKYDLVVDAVGKAKTSALRVKSEKSLTPDGHTSSIDGENMYLDSSRLNRITKLVESGDVIPILDRIYTLDEIVDAHHYVETGHKVGGVAITVYSQ